MSNVSTALSQATTFAKNAITPVSILPSIIVGIIVVVLGMIITVMIMLSNRRVGRYDANGCQIDVDGNVIKEPIYKSQNGTPTIIGYKSCVREPWAITGYAIGFVISLVIAFLIGKGVYTLMFYYKNPKIGAGLFAWQMVTEDM